MRLGLYVDMRNPVGSGRPWSTHYDRWLERIELAEDLGCPNVWLTEHHFFDDGYLPQCWTLAAAIAARTSEIRIGSAVALLPLHSSLETAEQVAIADVISNGRIEPGFGVGYRRPEYESFEGDFKHRYSIYRQRIGELRTWWGETAQSSRVVTPPPVQRPMPMWGGFGGPQGAKLAGELGLGLQSLDPGLLAPYLKGLAIGGHDSSQARMAGNVEVMVTDDPERTWTTIEPYVAARWRSYNRYMFEGTSREHDPPVHFNLDAVRDNFLIGTAEEIAGRIRERTAGLPVTDVYFWADYPGLDDDAVERHIELALTELAPLLAAPA